jgi:hypothetical protein
MFKGLKSIFQSKAKLYDEIQDFTGYTYRNLCAQYYQTDQYEHVRYDEGVSYVLETSEDDLNHPDRPQWIDENLRTNFHENPALFDAGIGMAIWDRKELKLDNVKAEWLKDPEIMKTMAWYLNNMDAACKNEGLKLSLTGVELFRDTEHLLSLPDKQRLDLHFKFAYENVSQDDYQNISCEIADYNGQPLTTATLQESAKLQLHNDMDRRYIALKALWKFFMFLEKEETDILFTDVETVTLDGFAVPLKDIASFAVEQDKGPSSQYRDIQAYRNRLSQYHPAFPHTLSTNSLTL